MPVPVVVPRMGLTMTEGTVLRWLKNQGDPVTKGEPVLELMTDKVSMEVEAPASGILSKIIHLEDAVVPVGEPLAFISTADEAAASVEPSSPHKDSAPKVTPIARRMAAEHAIDLAAIQGTGEGGTITKEDLTAHLARAQSNAAPTEPVRASPAARRVARELGVDLARIQGTGPEGRITERDVRDSVLKQQVAPPAQPRIVEPPQASAPTLPLPVTASTPVRGIRQVIAERMTQSFQTTPHFYLTVELDAAALLDLNRRAKSRAGDAEPQVTVTDLLVKFVAAALQEHPFANASWHNGSIEQYGQVNVGIAVATDQGLLVPVIKNANRLDVQAIARARHEVVTRARAGKLTLADVSDGTCTISNLGMYGIDQFAGIINPPQSTLLAVGRIKERPFGINGEMRLHPTVFVTLSADHRVMDGAQAAVLLQRIGELIEQPALLVV